MILKKREKAAIIGLTVLTLLGVFALGNKSAKADLIRESGVAPQVQVSSTVVSRDQGAISRPDFQRCYDHIVNTGDFNPAYCERIAEDDSALEAAFLQWEGK
jgi:hypothetical protein